VARLAGPESVPVAVIDRVWRALVLLLDETGDSLGVVFVDERAADVPLAPERRRMPGSPRAPRAPREEASGGSLALGVVAVGLLGLYAWRRRGRGR